MGQSVPQVEQPGGRHMPHPPVVQVSLDLTNIDEALHVAEIAVRAGVDWLEAGTPLILAEGLHGVRALRSRFPHHPIVADLKTMDGGYLEAEMMARAGANMVVVMSQAHPATVRAVVRAAREFGLRVMGDVLAAPDKPAAARALQRDGCDYIIVHTGFDERHERVEASPWEDLAAVVAAVDIPVQAVGGLKLEDLDRLPAAGAPLVVVGAPLVIDHNAFRAASEDEALEMVLRDVVRRVKGSASAAR
jgi:3-hexulose-6-phosphate synthase/6-phospho-3-hexuloisomerase